MISINETSAPEDKLTKVRRRSKCFLDELTTPVISLSPAGSHPPPIEVVRFAAGGIACIIAPEKLSQAQVEHVLDLNTRLKCRLDLPAPWKAWAVWTDPMWTIPPQRPRPSFTIQFGC